MQLYQFPYSHNCAKVKVVLLEKGLAFAQPPLPGGSTRSPEFLALNPLGKTPLLVDGDVVVGESEVIAEYLEDRYPTPSLLPADAVARARSRWLSRFHDLYLGPQLSTLFFALSDGRAGTAAFAPEIDKLFDQVAVLERAIDPAPYLLGSTFTLADAAYPVSYFYIGMLTQAHQRPLTPEQMPKLAKWFASISQRPSVAQVLAECQAALAKG